MPDASTFVALDFETAGPSRATTCAIGYALISGGEIKESAQLLVNPNIPASEWGGVNMAIHGIRPSQVGHAPLFFDAWRQVMQKANGAVLFAHNASFDMSVLRQEHARYREPVTGYTYGCTAQVTRRLWPEFGTTALSEIADHLDLELAHHNAESDARACASILMRAVRETKSHDVDGCIAGLGLRLGTISSADDWIPCGSGIRRSGSRATGQRDRVRQLEEDPSHPFFGNVVVFTGSLGSMNRRDAKGLVTDLGGKTASTVTGRTNYLVIGGYTRIPRGVDEFWQSTKLRTALKLREQGQKIEFLTEGDFLALL